LSSDIDALDDQARPEHEEKRSRFGPESPSTASKPAGEPGTENFGHPFDPSRGSEARPRCRDDTLPEPHWRASLTRSRRRHYILLAGNPASQFAEAQTPSVKSLFLRVKKQAPLCASAKRLFSGWGKVERTVGKPWGLIHPQRLTLFSFLRESPFPARGHRNYSSGDTGVSGSLLSAIFLSRDFPGIGGGGR